MRLDHIALRVSDRNATAKFYQEAFGYRIQAEFKIEFDDGSTADCFALEPSEKHQGKNEFPWKVMYPEIIHGIVAVDARQYQEYHTPPEIFVSDGPPGSIVGDWVARRGGIGGIHHMAWQVDDVEATMNLWREKGWAEFTSDKPLSCDGVVQVFTKPLSVCGGVIHEFIKREEHGFCKNNVKRLMESTKNM